MATRREVSRPKYQVYLLWTFGNGYSLPCVSHLASSPLERLLGGHLFPHRRDLCRCFDCRVSRWTNAQTPYMACPWRARCLACNRLLGKVLRSPCADHLPHGGRLLRSDADGHVE